MDQDLGKGYTFLSEGSNRFIITDFIFKDGIYPNVLNYTFDENYILVMQKATKESVEPYLIDQLRVKYGYILYSDELLPTSANSFLNSKVWKDSLWNRNISNEILRGNYIRNYRALQKAARIVLSEDEFFKKMFSREINFYIIDKNSEKVYGPFSEKDFYAQLNAMDVSPNLKFK
ncbi:hypothetical protein R1T16_12440 [Flavobacterium sp. DG1-102-2]|uniref:hypothetical protein n=1 Tax=Flavobacterium sp. DG1-102-2 TaxID=3081663 RepID=UPI0029490791|nr:hypothetical protein [Flavobacterium sp. DG1-102-2]MDV6169235.1 hypothetical protein [Flavobacterium sp. DG1-102-2]